MNIGNFVDYNINQLINTSVTGIPSSGHVKITVYREIWAFIQRRTGISIYGLINRRVISFNKYLKKNTNNENRGDN